MLIGKHLTGGADFIIENGGSGNYTQSFEAVVTGGIITFVSVLQPAKQEQIPDITLLS
jgi:NADPH:quinone reductase-like Zn-dependent oxidoreductase